MGGIIGQADQYGLPQKEARELPPGDEFSFYAGITPGMMRHADGGVGGWLGNAFDNATTSIGNAGMTAMGGGSDSHPILHPTQDPDNGATHNPSIGSPTHAPAPPSVPGSIPSQEGTIN